MPPSSPAAERGGRAEGASSGASPSALEELRAALEEYERGQRSGDSQARRERLLQEEQARQTATRSLNAAPRTRAQLEGKLSEKGLPEDVIASVLDRYEEVGLVDDLEFARGWIRSRAEQKGLAAVALREELKRKGIAASTVEQALGEILDDEREASAGEDLARAKARAVVRRMGAENLQTRQEQDKALRKIVAAVARKGHSPGSAFGWAREALAEELRSA